MLESGIYKITNIITKDFYIGQAKNIKSRWHNHLFDLRNRIHNNVALQEAWSVCGESNFTFEVICFCDAKMLNFYERRFIFILDPPYNVVKYRKDNGFAFDMERKQKWYLKELWNDSGYFNPYRETAKKLKSKKKLKIYEDFEETIEEREPHEYQYKSSSKILPRNDVILKRIDEDSFRIYMNNTKIGYIMTSRFPDHAEPWKFISEHNKFSFKMEFGSPVSALNYFRRTKFS